MAKRRHSIVTIVSAIFLAVLLWGYVSLSGEYESDVAVTLVVDPPANQALISTLPAELTVRVRTSGLQLVNMQYLSSAPRCVINLQSVQQSSESMYTIDREDIIRALAFPGAIKVVSIQPSTLSMATGEVFTKLVPIELRHTITCRDGFIVVGDPQAEPRTVEIRGTRSVVEGITTWPTQKLSLDDVHESATFEVPMSDSLAMLLRVEPRTVSATFNVQQKAEAEIQDVVIEIANGGEGFEVHPSRISVAVSGGTEQVVGLLASDIKARVPSDQTGAVRPVIDLPRGVTLVATYPPFVRLSRVSVR